MKSLQPKEEVQKIVAFIQETMKSAGFLDVVIGVSGGIDSAVSLALSVKALGTDHVYPVLLPYGALNTSGVLDAMGLIETLHVPFTHIVRIDIQSAVDAVVRQEVTMDRVRKGNVMARMRMIYLFDQAKKRNALVMGTENKSEYLLGYFTRFGDEASDIEPIVHLFKTQVYELARVLEIPEKIVNKAPSADLWPEQTDEKELGFGYHEADELLENDGENDKQDNVIIRQKEKNEFKHHLPMKLSK